MKELGRLQALLDDIKSGSHTERLLAEFPELSAKLVENEKLKYRIDIMKRVSLSLTPLHVQSIDDVKKTATAVKPRQEKAPEVKYVKVKDFKDAVLEKLLFTFAQVVEKVKRRR